MSNRKIYLDYNATTPLEPSVVASISEALENAWGNPSSSYHEGVVAKNIIQKARSSVANVINAQSTDIVFTSGGTEANNMVLQIGLKHFASNNVGNLSNCQKPHFITTNIEHDSIKLVLENFEAKGFADVTFVNVSKKSGRVEPDDVIAALRPETCMVTVMMANNETGVIQPIKEIGARMRCLQKDRHFKVLLHTDAAQTIGKINVDVSDIDVDYLTVVGHKFYGPRIGALYIRGAGTNYSVPNYPLFYGGGQERNFRPGTENTPMIAGLGEAAQLVSDNLPKYESHMRAVRQYLEENLQKTFSCAAEGLGVHFNGKFDTSERLPNTCNFSLSCDGIKELSGSLILSKCQHTVASVGAACHSGIKKGSHILLATGVPENVAMCAIRMSVGRHTTKEDIDLVISDLYDSVLKLKENQC